MNNLTPDAAKIKMADLCARSEQCEADIRQKLYRLGLTSAQVQQIVSELINEKFIDNERYARSFARDKCRFSCWGKYKIRLALMAKRLSPAEISQGIEAIEPNDYLDALRRTAEAKARSLDLIGEGSYENRLKLFRHLQSRGFESDLSSKAIKEIIEKQREQKK